MQLYYTTSAGYEQPQTVVAKSLGGYRSANIVKNDDFDNLFGEISSYTIREKRDEYIALMLRNTTGAEVTNVEAWFVPPTENYARFEIAAVRTATDADGDPIFERTRTRFTRPFVADFAEATDASRFLIGTMAIDEEVGLWIRRIINSSTITTTLETIYERDPANINLYREIVFDKTETQILTINYT